MNAKKGGKDRVPVVLIGPVGKRPPRLLEIFDRLDAGEIDESEAVEELRERRLRRFGRFGRFWEALAS